MVASSPDGAAGCGAHSGANGKRRYPPRRSGEAQPLRAFRACRRLCATGFVEGGAGRRRRQRSGQSRRPGHHQSTGAMAVPAIQVRGARGLVALGIDDRITHRIDARTGISLVLVMTEMRSVGPGLVRAMRRRRRPGKVDR